MDMRAGVTCRQVIVPAGFELGECVLDNARRAETFRVLQFPNRADSLAKPRHQPISYFGVRSLSHLVDRGTKIHADIAARPIDPHRDGTEKVRPCEHFRERDRLQLDVEVAQRIELLPEGEHGFDALGDRVNGIVERVIQRDRERPPGILASKRFEVSLDLCTLLEIIFKSRSEEREAPQAPLRRAVFEIGPFRGISSARVIDCAAPGPCTVARASRIFGDPRRNATVTMSWMAAPSPLVTTPITLGSEGNFRFFSGANNPSSESFCLSRSSASSSAPLPAGRTSFTAST